MKKALKIFGGLIVLVFILMLVLPYFYKDKLVELVKTEANKNLNATLDFDDVDLTFFAHFPQLTLKIEDLTLTGQGEFEGVQLVSFNSFNLVLGLSKVLAGEKIPDINKIFIDSPKVTALVLKSGKVNWDIVKTKGSKQDSLTPSEDSDVGVDFNILLKYYEIKDAEISYIDETSKTILTIEGLDHSGSGNFGASNFGLATKTHIDKITYQMETTKYIDNSTFNAEINFDVDLDAMRFDITNGDIQLNKFALKTSGFIEMAGDDMKVDINFTSPSTELKQLMALVPKKFTGDLDEYKFTGNVAFNGWVKGVLNENEIPLFGMHLSVDNGSFHYADLPKTAEKIEIKVDIELKNSKDLNSLVVDVNQFNMDLGGNPINASLNLINPMTSMDVKSNVKAVIDLASLKDVMPIEKEDELNGKIESDLNFEGSLEAAGNEEYDKLKANGFVKMQDFTYRSSAFNQPVLINNTELIFDMDKAELKSLEVKIGKSDFSATGQLTDFLPYALMNKELKGALNYHSDYLDLDELIAFAMTEDEEEKDENKSKDEQSEAKADKTKEQSDQKEEKLIPENVSFILKASIDKLKYDDIDIKDFNGVIRLKKGKLKLENCRLNTLGGSVVANGSFDEIKKGESKVAFNFRMKNLSIKQSADKIEMVKKYAPMAKYTKGTFTTNLVFRSTLDKALDPVLNTVYSKGKLLTHNVQIEGYKPLNTFAEVTKTKDIVLQKFDDLIINYEIIDGKAFIKPFNFKIDKLTGNSFGSVDLEQNLDFLVHLKIPTEMLGDDANQLMGQLAGALADYGVQMDVPEFIEMDVAITGKTDNPKFKPSIAGISSDNAKEIIKEKAKEEFDKAKAEAKKRAKAEADKIIADAQKEADKLMREARKQGAALKKEGYKQADDLVESASGFLEKTAAEIAAKEAKKQVDKQVDNLIKEAQKQADKIMDDARKQAARIK